MAMINCPECGKEISDSVESCPFCGYPIKNREAELQNNTNGESTKKKPFKKTYLIIAVVAICLIAVLGVKISNKKKLIAKQNSEVQEIKEYNQYVTYLNDVYSETLSGASTAEDVCVLVLNVWQDAIYHDSSDQTSKYVTGASDFDEALDRVYADDDVQDKLSKVKNYQDYLSDSINKLQSAPPELEKAYDAALEASTTFKALAQMALSPSGSYNTYSADEQDKVNAIISAYNTLESLIPGKKEVPVYDKNGKKVENDLAFLIYLGQMTNKLPNEIKEQSTGSMLGMYNDEATICEKNGEITYYSSNKVINGVQWRIDSYKDSDKQQLISYLEERYGEATESNDGLYWSNNDNIDNAYVSMEEKENGQLVITWN